MKKLLALTIASLYLLCGCAALTQGKFVTRDGKESPFQGRDDRHERFQDPYGRF